MYTGTGLADRWNENPINEVISNIFDRFIIFMVDDIQCYYFCDLYKMALCRSSTPGDVKPL
ncbi:hypothetical protein ICU399_31270 [Acinetobacter baumannii]|uniref:Uncharacterized protein n=1 Tax=Acinetobacter baumannii TaxID=470 RepID=A0A6F8THA5_ACIBA|nr:hypothetical protein ATCC19606_26830 [Acinetobacter baumannii]